MLINGILDHQSVLVDDDSPSKKRVLERSALLLASGDAELAERVFERLLERERLGSTGLAGGVALPHARVPGVDSTKGAFIRLAEPVDFDALDGNPVDLVFALLVPEEATDEHLQLLAQLAGMFKEPRFCQQLREADVEQAHALLTGQTAHHAA
jgi:PTS system nitrogen regulatory IIA component